MDNNEYENTVRSNESIRDAMDGKLDEPRMTESREESNCQCDNNNSECFIRG